MFGNWCMLVLSPFRYVHLCSPPVMPSSMYLHTTARVSLGYVIALRLPTTSSSLAYIAVAIMPVLYPMRSVGKNSMFSSSSSTLHSLRSSDEMSLLSLLSAYTLNQSLATIFFIEAPCEASVQCSPSTEVYIAPLSTICILSSNTIMLS